MMGGYLRRLAEHGATPGPRLRPLLSIYRRASEPVEEIFQPPATFASHIDPREPVASVKERRVDGATNVLHPSRPATEERPKDASESADSVEHRQAVNRADHEQPPLISDPVPAVIKVPSPDHWQAAWSPDVRDGTRENGALRARSSPSSSRRSPSSAAAADLSAGGRRTAAAAEPLPDVHIHIGRIELTASAPPAPVRRQTAPAPTAMPLHEYLQRRDGKRR